jgi:hypothetical protein
MSFAQVMPGRLARWISVAEPDWDAVYAEQLPRVYNFFRYRLGAGADVEDLTSRTFERAWRARHQYRRDGRLLDVAAHDRQAHRHRPPAFAPDARADRRGGACRLGPHA